MFRRARSSNLINHRLLLSQVLLIYPPLHEHSNNSDQKTPAQSSAEACANHLLELASVDEGDDGDDEVFDDGEEEDTEDEREDSDEPDEEETSDVSDVTETLIIWPMSRRTASSQQFVPFTLQHQKPRPCAGQGIT
ncbi:hypothetical protein VN97_g424 [Penicillium thymicola]|uniref:Uncharacterized protein n=1 Tax=Penicillium thymicola TaxID=293382 RepID=A0AAI9TUM6_PENTH|nr:hypothetical protein VN97_g424 [Penicillium thymicola]